jgi:hypothetical protein
MYSSSWIIIRSVYVVWIVSPLLFKHFIQTMLYIQRTSYARFNNPRLKKNSMDNVAKLLALKFVSSIRRQVSLLWKAQANYFSICLFIWIGLKVSFGISTYWRSVQISKKKLFLQTHSDWSKKYCNIIQYFGFWEKR